METHNTMGIDRVRLHVALSVLTYHATIIAHIQQGRRMTCAGWCEGLLEEEEVHSFGRLLLPTWIYVL